MRIVQNLFLLSVLPFFVSVWMLPLPVHGNELLVSDNREDPWAVVDWQTRVTAKATISVFHKTVPLISSKNVFWAQKWKWAGVRMTVNPADADGTRAISGKIRRLGVVVSGAITSPKHNQLRFTWKLQADKSLEGIIGGGLSFSLNLASPSLRGASSDPVLLPDNRGWVWKVGKEDELRVEFDNPIASVHFVRGNKSKIRMMFIGNTLLRGLHTVSMTVTLPKGGREIDLVKRYGPTNTAKWYSNALLANVSPVDLSFLNHRPAGLHGFVKARGNSFVFEDGAPIRFWGTNIAAASIFSEKANIKTQAKRLAKLGYNLVRIHHHDSTGWVPRTVIDKKRSDTRHLDPEVMDRLDYWINALKEEGIYIWLDLHVGRLFKRGDDLGPGGDEILARARRRRAKRRRSGRSRKQIQGASGRGYNYYNERIETLMKEFNENYLTHFNPYTKLSYIDEPAIMGLLITNENDLTNHFGNLMLSNKKNPFHNRIFDASVREFSRKNNLPYKDTRKTWLPGPSKIFLADREWQWNRRMLEHLRSIGVKIPVATTHMWGKMQLHGLPPLTAGDIIDVHSYGAEEALSINPRYADNFITYMATGQLSGKPTTITEWNVPYPSVDRFTSPLYVASIASLQGWDAPMVYNYSQGNFRKRRRIGKWSTFLDPALTGLMPAAALLYRQRHVKESENTHLIRLDRKQLYYTNNHPKNMASLRTLVERSKVILGLPNIKELDWDSEIEPPEGAKLVVNLNMDFIPPDQNFVQSDTGELVRSWTKGYQSINTERTQAIHGWIGGKKFNLKDVFFKIDTEKAAVVVSSLDGNPIIRSRRLLITAIARAVTRRKNRKPFMSEPVTGKISIKATPGLRLYALAADGTKGKPLPIKYLENTYLLEMPLPEGTHWFMLEKF